MAILKQNGVNGKILRSNDGNKVMKQNYNFGKGFTLENETLTIENINLPILTLGFWNKIIQTNTVSNNLNFFELRLFDSLNNSLLHVARSNNFGSNYQVVFNNVSDTQVLGQSNCQLNTFALINIGIDVNLKEVYFYRNNLQRLTLSYSSALNNISKIEIKYGALDSRINDVFLYDRLISSDEILYKYNNQLSNDLLNLSGLLNNTRCEFAEIYNYSGIDGVSIHNELSTEPIKITGLPAGTIQEQLDYANANLFENW